MDRKKITKDNLLSFKHELDRPYSGENLASELWMNFQTYERIKSELEVRTSLIGSATIHGLSIKIDNLLPTGLIETDIQRKNRLDSLSNIILENQEKRDA